MARFATNPKAPAKPLRIVIQSFDDDRGQFAVTGFLGSSKVGYVDCYPLRERESDLPGHAVRELLGGLPGWVVRDAFLAHEKYRHQGYGTQMYMAAFAEAVRRSGGPIVIGAARPMLGYVGTSKDAEAVWARIIGEGLYPAHPSKQAVVFRPEDVEPWMLPRKRLNRWKEELPL